MADVPVDAIAKQGFAAAVRADQTIGAQGADGSCIAVAWIHIDGRRFAAHVDFSAVRVTAVQCAALWDTLTGPELTTWAATV